jgi:hypothetical protein
MLIAEAPAAAANSVVVHRTKVQHVDRIWIYTQTALAIVIHTGQACMFSSRGAVMSKQTNILQILPATGWVAVYDEGGEESAAALVCFALTETTDNGGKQQAVRPMCANGKHVVFADDIAHFLRVEEMSEFAEDEEDDEEEEDAEG